jgi:predicted transcriptional regulator
MKVPTARDCMTVWFVTLRPDMDVYEAIDILASKRASGAPVLDAEGNLVGILTEKDCLRVMSHEAYGQLSGGVVGDYMSEPKGVLTVDMDLFSVAREFLNTNFAVLPVLENGNPVGRISRQDMLRGIQCLQRESALEKERYEDHLKTMQSPMSINDLQRLAASQRPENLAALLSNRHG